MQRIRPSFLAALFYLLISIAITWPLALHLGTHVANDLGDSLLNMSIMAWNSRTLPLSDQWWSMPQFYPVYGATAFSEHLLGLAPITTPVLLLTKNPVLAYNLAVFLSFPFAALAAYALGWSITRRHDAALVAGLAFGFAPYRFAQLAHVQVLSSYWMPLSLVGLVRYFDSDRRSRWLLLFAVAWLMQALTCGYYFFYFSILIGLWLIWFAVGRSRWSELLRVLAFWAAAVALMSPILYGYWRIQRMYGMRRWPDEIAAFSADVASLLKATPELRLWGWLNILERPESDLFPGATLLVLIVVGVVVAWRSMTSGRRLRVVPVLLAAAVVFLLVAPTPILFGPWKLEIGGIQLLSVRTPHKPLSVAFALLILVAAVSPTARAVWARRSKFAFFLLAAVVMWVFALGPAPTLMNQPILYKSPYTWLMLVPGVEGVRVPARFWTLALLCLAAAAALSLVRLGARWPRLQRTFAIVACIGILAEGWPSPMKLPAAPERRPNHTAAQARLDLPLSDLHDLKALYWGIFHRRPLVNGYSGYFAPHYWVFRFLLEQRDPEVLTAMSKFGDLEVVIDHEEDADGRLQRFVSSHAAAEEVFTSEQYSSYRIRSTASAVSHKRIEGSTLPVASSSATVGSHLLPRMSDGDIVSRWDGRRPQQPGDSLTLDLGASHEVRGVELDLGGYVADFPRRLRIETSVDGAAWEERWVGSGGGAALAGALLDARLMPLIFEFDARPARYIRMTQLGSDPVFYWTVAELKVFGT